MEEKPLRWKAYELYRLNWLRDHEYGIGDIFSSIAEFAEADENDDRITDKHALTDLFERWEQDSGFNGSLWCCYDEFMVTEYLDPSVMLKMLPAKNRGEYLVDYANLKGYKPGMLCVTTKDGRYVVERCMVIPGDYPKMVRYMDFISEKAPLTVQWQKACIRLDNGEEYPLQKDGNKWKLLPF